MRTWIAIHFKLLSLEIYRPCWNSSGTHVVIDHDLVCAASFDAIAQGVRFGMKRGGAIALCASATLHERDIPKEQLALNDIALALLRYTPEVALSEEFSLVLDVTASLRAFGGRLALCRLIKHSMAQLGFSAAIGMAPTAQGAWLLARQEARPALRRAIRMQTLLRLAYRLPLGVLPAAQNHANFLHGIGCRTLGDIHRLPRAGLKRRCGKDLLEALDKLHGKQVELFSWIQAPPAFHCKLELPERIEQAEAVLFGAQRLILQMTGWLVAKQYAVEQFKLWLDHERGRHAIDPTVICIVLTEATWQEEHLIRLLKEHLGRIALPAPVIALRIEASQVIPMQPVTATLFPEPGGTPADYRRLLELLSARLGSERVLSPAFIADYRPEISNRWAPATHAGHIPSTVAPTKRPCWLLPQPKVLTMHRHRPVYGSPLRLLHGPERIESGWWDNVPVMRDYFIAQGDDASCYWIYRERTGQEVRWFLHGLFG